jgi:hypothetical protein
MMMIVYRFTDMTVTVIDRIVLDMILGDVNNREGVLALCFVFALAWFGKPKYGI